MEAYARPICENVHMMPTNVSADDLLVLLEVARCGKFTRAAETLGLNHVTVSRRIAALEHAAGGKVLVRAGSGWEPTPLGRRLITAAEEVDAALRGIEAGPSGETAIEDVVRMSSPDAFSTFVAAPAAARLHLRHPGVSVEIVAATRRAAQHRSGVDIEVVVGEPQVVRAEAFRLGGYALGLYASDEYLGRNDRPSTVGELREHDLIYFIPSMLQVDDLDVCRRYIPDMRDAVTSTNVFTHVSATRAGAGIGLLPTFMADRHENLVHLLPREISIQMDYWLVARADTLRRPSVAELVQELRSATDALGSESRRGRPDDADR